MNESYVECLVKAKTSTLGNCLKVFLIVLCAVTGIVSLLIGSPLLLIVAAACGVGAYFVILNTDLEFEYLYVDRELFVDKVMAKSKRKRIASYTLDRMEVMAPIKSYHLDNFRSRDKGVKVKDYSIREELQPDRRYAIYYEGNEKVIISPSEELVKAMKSVAPRKIFSD